MTRQVLASIAAVLAAACTSGKPRGDTAKSGAAQRGASARQVAWVVTPAGIGPLRAGMSRAQAEAAIGVPLAVDGDSTWNDCDYTSDDGLPPGVELMVEEGTLARVDVDSGSIATAEGARIGDSEGDIRKLYAGRVVTTPHKYTDGHYLTVRPLVAADSNFRIVFETDGNRVTNYRAGRLPPVEYVEGCS